MRDIALLLVSQLALIVTACAPESRGNDAIQARAPALGKTDGSDTADRQCQIVLRRISRQPGSNGYKTQCTAGVCNWVWEGTVDVADGVQGTVHLLYHLAGDPTWWQVDATPSGNAQRPGFVRHDFGIHEHLIGPWATQTELAAAHIELVPFLQLPDGTRLFDHNRRPGNFDNYVIDEQSYFGLPDEPVCDAVVGRISLFSNWDEYFTGELRQGGHIQVHYDLDRLPQCRGTHDGAPAWDTVAHVRFLPGNQLLSGSVRSFVTYNGLPTGMAESKDLTLKIPTDATSLQIWFQNHATDGSSCQAWDSNFGKNYGYDVWPPATDLRCKNIEQWSTINSDMPYASKPTCVAYIVDKQYNATNCELYLDGIGQGYMGHYGIPNNWVEAYIKVGPQQGTLLGVGMLTRYRDTATGATSELVTLGRKVDANTWQTGFISLRPGIMGSQGYQYDVQQMAFFIDVKRPTGEIVRLWQSRGGANYGWADAFTLPSSTVSIPYGNIKYADKASPIFDARQVCKK